MSFLLYLQVCYLLLYPFQAKSSSCYMCVTSSLYRKIRARPDVLYAKFTSIYKVCSLCSTELHISSSLPVWHVEILYVERVL